MCSHRSTVWTRSRSGRLRRTRRPATGCSAVAELLATAILDTRPPDLFVARQIRRDRLRREREILLHQLISAVLARSLDDDAIRALLHRVAAARRVRSTSRCTVREGASRSTSWRRGLERQPPARRALPSSIGGARGCNAGRDHWCSPTGSMCARACPRHLPPKRRRTDGDSGIPPAARSRGPRRARSGRPTSTPARMAGRP